MSVWWDKVNKWLYFGTKEGQSNQFVLQFDNWTGWLFPPRILTIRDWSLFSIKWDNGAWWFSDLGETEKMVIPSMDGNQIITEEWEQKSGLVNCFLRIVVLGIGLRYQYQKSIVMKFSLNKTGVK